VGASALLTRMPGHSSERGEKARRILWWAYGFAGLLLAAYVISVFARPTGSDITWLDDWGVDAFEIVLSAMCIARGFARQGGRAIAFTLGIAALCWAVGDVLLTVESMNGATPPSPSWADLAYLLFYPTAYVGIVLLMRRELKRISPPSFLDGAVAGLGIAALCAAFAFHSIAHTAGGSALSVTTNLAYPIGDVLLLALVVTATTLLQGRGKGPWTLIAVGLAVNVVGDTFNLFGSTVGSSRIGSALNAIAWPIAILLISIAVWLRPKQTGRLVAEKTSGFLLPGIASAAGLGVLLTASLHKTSRVAIGISAATLLLAGIRLALSSHALRSLTEERHKQAVTDELTGLGNRRKLIHVFESFFETRDSMSPESRQSLAFLFVDLDHFKEINDSFGHPAGDALLKQLGPRLLAAVRSTDVVVRLGGDEFGVVLINSDVEDAKRVAERLTASLEEPFVLDMVSARVGASIGISILETDADDAAGLLRCADVAMFRAKTGSGSFAFYDEAIDDMNLLLLAEELRVAVEEGTFELHYQPQLDLQTGRITAVEALLRWNNPRMGMVPPLKFLPLAEESGLMPALTQLVLDDALAQCASWRAEGQEVAVSVNVSASNLLETDFTEMVSGLLERHEVPSSALVLEITETCIISDYERSKKVIEDLRNLGLIVSIDDFGAGFTSLAYLGDLAVGELKLDRVFVTGLGSQDRTRDLALIRSTIELAHALRLRVVAEGIEDSATLALLSELRCDIAQGYFIGRPMPASQLVFDSTLVASGDAALVG
jgi:diguanylate cyclase (GGDEF)-like protein